MTTLDPSHIPNPFSTAKHTAWGQATHTPPNLDSEYPDEVPTTSGPSSSRPGGALHVPRIPELRFEQSYLLSIKPFIHQGGHRERQAAETETEHHEATRALVKEGVLDDSLYGVPLHIDWQGVAWVTLRDQFLSPIVQGAVWGTASIFLVPATQRFWSLFKAGDGKSSAVLQSQQTTPPSGPTEVGPWRRWLKTWFGALQTNTVLAR
ncbi:hypothetical protein FRB95_011754 [Tulasnella sp. JGI-2019a]|nr:hypothetical protein FRB95_011754 [Tulasnella sp. JGI-2019a]